MKRAFSLVELSIVLVILGLLTGGILAGQSLIRAAELRSVSTDYQRYVAAGHTFRDKYFAIPGDMANATKFWGDDNAACPDGAIPNGTPGTCNGNGDGIVTYALVAGGTGEAYQLWKQLALAGLIEGTYSGLAGPSANQHGQIGINVPRSRMPRSGWTAYNHSQAGHGIWTDFEYGNDLWVGADFGTTSSYGPIMKPEEAWNVDVKLDDGKPQRGKVMVIGWDTCTNAGSSADLNGDYALMVTGVECALSFPRTFGP